MGPVCQVERAVLLKSARPVLSVDSGQQRFGCPLSEAAALLKQTGIEEAFTHAVTAAQARRFDAATIGHACFRHAAGTSLLDDPAARFDAIRPGLALYVGAARVSARLVEVHAGASSAGYTGFTVPFHGVIRCGYSNGLRSGPCIVNRAV